MKTTESTPETLISPFKHLRILLNQGDITLHLRKIDGIELTYRLNKEGDSFIEDVSDFNDYQVIVNTQSDYDLELS